MTGSLTITIPNHKADRDLGANSRAFWRVKHRKLTRDKNTAFLLLTQMLNLRNQTAEDFLTDGGKHPIEDALPLSVTFRRLYSGRAQQWDTDNLYSAYKGLQDGLAAALQLSDKYFHTVTEQERDDFTELEIEIVPAWVKREEAVA